MGKIFYIMGKSSTGKDTIYKELLASGHMELKRIVPYTTRPIRVGETEGVEYHFTDEAGLQRIREAGNLIELREYNTCHGVWKYFTVADTQIDLIRFNYLIIGTIESYVATKEYFGEAALVPILIDLDDGVRLQRALTREMSQASPKYEEMCRRFLADSADFSAEKIQAAGIRNCFYNNELHKCLAQIEEYIKAQMS